MNNATSKKTQVRVRYSRNTCACTSSVVGFPAVGYEWATQLNRYFLDPIDLWPAEYRGKRKRFTTLVTTVCVTISLLVCTIPSLCSLFVSCGDTILFTDNLGYFIPIVISHLKYFIIYTKKNGNFCTSTRIHMYTYKEPNS